jgi:hypothetical protein
MANSATPAWVEYNGATPTPTDINYLYFGNIDSPLFTPLSYPIRAGYNSYSKYIKIRFSGSFVEVANLKLWQSSGSFPGISLRFGGIGITYSVPSTGDTGDSNIPTAEPTFSNISGTINTSGGESVYLRLQLHTTTSAEAIRPIDGNILTLSYNVQ